MRDTMGDAMGNKVYFNKFILTPTQEIENDVWKMDTTEGPPSVGVAKVVSWKQDPSIS